MKSLFGLLSLAAAVPLAGYAQERRNWFDDMEATVKRVDDVMGVINHLQVGAQAEPRYRAGP